MSRWRAVLEGACAKQEIDNVAFVRLQPVQLVSSDGSNIQPINVSRIQQLTGEGFIFGDRSTNQSLTDFFQHLVLGAIDHRHEWKHVFGIRHCIVRIADMKHGRTQVIDAFLLNQPVARTGHDMFDALYALFPGGPAKKASKIAGLPKPKGCV